MQYGLQSFLYCYSLFSTMTRTQSQIQKMREAAGLSQREVAKLLKVSFFTFRSWDQGKRAPPLSRVKDIARALACSVADLL